jgi:hypothetical protein
MDSKTFYLRRADILLREQASNAVFAQNWW